MVATEPEDLDQLVQQHILFALRRRKLARRLQDVVATQCCKAVRVVSARVSAEIRTPKQIALAAQREAETSVLPKVATKLRPESDRTIFGMDDVVLAMAEELAGPRSRSLLLVGPSGVGKTSAVRELANQSRGLGLDGRVFRQRDRSFADMFHLIVLDEPDEATTLRTLIHAMRDAESEFGVAFALDVLPVVLEFTRRYQRELAYPGKAIRWLRDLAIKFRGGSIDRQESLTQFQAKTGIRTALADGATKLRRDEIVANLSVSIIRQEAAVEAMADVMTVAAARLNDPHRPLGSLLFLGPTGVGKTHCAKVLAAYLFSNESRLLRFDMNEFPSAYSATRLVGTFARPDGLLTQAVRNQPYSILLFDEIEKAHPDVHDLLLQILGEARLTDALGRVVDFSNTVIILTSNLGTRDALRQLGFANQDGARAEPIYLKAVREFFRPEFVNRFDRIVPFSRLSREDVKLIVAQLMADILSREGLSRRKCALDVTDDAIEWVVDQGYDPKLGARAIRRAVERRLVQPLSREMARL